MITPTSTSRSYTNVVDAYLAGLPAFSEPDAVGTQSSFGVESFARLFSLGSQRTLTLVDGCHFVANSPDDGATGTQRRQRHSTRDRR